MPSMSGGEAVAKSLVREGVEVVFGIAGIHLSGIIAGMRDEPGLRFITTRHEQGAAHMADGYARASRKPGIVMVVPGAALYNAASGLSTAYARSAPVVAIAAQIPRGQIGKDSGSIHEVLNQGEIVRPVTKWQRQALTPREIPDAVCEAFRQMRTGRPRPVLLEIPPEAGVERDDVELREPARSSRIVPSQEDLWEATRVIARSQLPEIFAGGGVARSDAEEALVRLAEVTNIPVITSGGGKGTIPDQHPVAYGSCVSPADERHEMNQLFEVMQSADVVIGIGTRFSMGNPAGNAATLVNINIDDSELTRVQSNTIPLHGDARATIEAMLPILIAAGAGDRSSPVEAVTAARGLIAYSRHRGQRTAVPKSWKPSGAAFLRTRSYHGTSRSSATTPARTIRSIIRRLTSTPGTHSTSVAHFPRPWEPRSAAPDRPVLCISGDGGFMFNSSELSPRRSSTEST